MSARSPDAALLESWHAYRQLYRQWRTADLEEESIDHEKDALEAHIFSSAAKTPAGLAVKLRILFAGMAEDLVSEEAVLLTDALPPVAVTDDRLGSLWRVIVDLERMGRLGAQP